MEGLIVLVAAAFLFTVFGVIGLLVKTAFLSEENRRLSRRIDELEKKRSPLPLAETPRPEPEHPLPPAETESSANEWRAAPIRPVAAMQPGSVEASASPEPAAASESPPALPESPAPESPPPPETAAAPPFLLDPVRRFIRGGNVWAAGGVALLAAGFATLITYLARRGFFTVEMGIIAAALTGLAMLAAGWIFKNRRRAYCLLLQGGGAGILYLSIFAARRLTPWFSPAAALVLLVLVMAPAVILALLQNSQLLAVFGFFGGFAAPLLVAPDSGGHVFIFSYYTILCLGVLVIGFFRFWRALNLLAFFCAFGFALFWTARFSRPELFWSSEPFFLGYILMFTALGIHCFGKKTFRSAAGFDGLLLLGTPLAAAVLQWRMFASVRHGHALVCIVFAAFYLGLSVFIRLKKGKEMRLFSESYLGVTVLLANLAVPLELSPRISGAVWAAEGAVFFFLGSRLKNAKVTVTALLLHAAAAAAFPVSIKVSSAVSEAGIFRGPAFSGALLIALAALALVIITRKFREDLVSRAAGTGGFFSAEGFYRGSVLVVLTIWFYLWWFGGWFAELRRIPHNPAAEPFFDLGGAFFLFCSITAPAGYGLAKALRCRSLLLGLVPSLVFALGLVLFAIFDPGAWSANPRLILSHNFFQGGRLWPWLAFFAFHALMALDRKSGLDDTARGIWLFTLILIAAAVTGSSGRALAIRFSLAPSWRSFAGLLPLFCAVISLSAGQRRAASPGGPGRGLLFFVLPLIFCCMLGLWFTVTLFLSGDPAPLPRYIPVLNPLDLLEAFSILVFLYWQSSLAKTRPDRALARHALFALTDAAVFFLVTALLARSMHFYGGLPYRSLFASEAFQLGLFILWALYGVAHIIAGTRLGFRRVWIAGAALTVTDIAKLLLLDLSGAGAPVRIISFFAAGLILLFIGWVSPLPPSSKSRAGDGGP